MDPTAVTQPLVKQQRGWWQALDAAYAWQQPRAERDRLEACSGPEGGAYLMTSASELGVALTDSEFELCLHCGHPLACA